MSKQQIQWEIESIENLISTAKKTIKDKAELQKVVAEHQRKIKELKLKL